MYNNFAVVDACIHNDLRLTFKRTQMLQDIIAERFLSNIQNVFFRGNKNMLKRSYLVKIQRTL